MYATTIGGLLMSALSVNIESPSPPVHVLSKVNAHNPMALLRPRILNRVSHFIMISLIISWWHTMGKWERGGDNQRVTMPR